MHIIACAISVGYDLADVKMQLEIALGNVGVLWNRPTLDLLPGPRTTKDLGVN